MLPSFFITGLYAYSTRRFKAIRTSSYIHAMGINLWRGSVWQLDSQGKRRLIKRVWN
jgi:hypothetical protein